MGIRGCNERLAIQQPVSASLRQHLDYSAIPRRDVVAALDTVSRFQTRRTWQWRGMKSHRTGDLAPPTFYAKSIHDESED